MFTCTAMFDPPSLTFSKELPVLWEPRRPRGEQAVPTSAFRVMGCLTPLGLLAVFWQFLTLSRSCLIRPREAPSPACSPRRRQRNFRQFSGMVFVSSAISGKKPGAARGHSLNRRGRQAGNGGDSRAKGPVPCPRYAKWLLISRTRGSCVANDLRLKSAALLGEAALASDLIHHVAAKTQRIPRLDRRREVPAHVARPIRWFWHLECVAAAVAHAISYPLVYQRRVAWHPRSAWQAVPAVRPAGASCMPRCSHHTARQAQ